MLYFIYFHTPHMHYLFKKAISIALVWSVIFSNSLQLLNSSVFAEEKAPNKCTRTVQWWSINPTDFSDIRVKGTFNGDYLTENNETSMDAVATNLTNQFSKYHESKWFPLYNFQYDANSSVLYIVDSEKNPVDSTKNIIEIFITNNTDSSEIVQDKEQTDGGFNDGLIYSNQDIPCETQPEECTAQIVQGWALNGSDFTNMSVSAYYGEAKFQNNYSSVSEMVGALNERTRDVWLSRTFELHNNIVYISNTDIEPLNSDKDYLEFSIFNNNDESYIVRESEDGKTQWLMYSNQDISDCGETPPEECIPSTVQGWTLNGSDFTNMNIELYYNWQLVSSQNYVSINDLIAGINESIISYQEKNWWPLYSLTIEDNTLYIVDSKDNRLDSIKESIEIRIIDENNKWSYIIGDEDQIDGGFTKGLVFSDIQLSDCGETPPEECTAQVVQGWLLNGSDFTNMTITLYYNWELVSEGDYSSINEVIEWANKDLDSFHNKTWKSLYVLTSKNNTLYITDSDINPLDSNKDKLELIIRNNNDWWYIVEDNGEVDGAYNEWLLYSNQDISDCEETPPEENTCTTFKTVQGWTLEGQDFSNMTIHGSYGKNSENFQIYSKEEILAYLNGDGGNKLGLSRTFAIQNNILYIVDSENNPVNSEEGGFIELSLRNNNTDTRIIEPNGKDGGNDRDWVIYWNKEISDCEETPPEENNETAEFICENNMVGFDLGWRSEIVSFRGAVSKKYGNNSKLIEALTNKQAIQEYLNSSFGTNQIIRYVNTDKSVTVRYNSEINPIDISFTVGYEDNSVDKLSSNTPTKHNLCDDDGNLPQVELTTYSICAPNIIYSSDQQVTCNFTVTNNGQVPANNVYVTEREMPDWFIIKKQSDNKPTVLNKWESVTYTIIGYQSIFPKQGSQVLTMGDVVFNYDYEKSSYDINTNTTIVVQAKKSSGSHWAGAWSNIIPVIINPTPTAPIPVVPVVPVTPTVPVVPTKPTSTWSTHTWSTGYKPIPVTPPTIVEIIKQETTKETIERVTAKVEDEGWVNFCVYEEYIPLNAWQDITDTEYSKDIKILINKCIVNGLDNQMLYYGPNKVIKKWEVVKIIAKWFKLPISNEIKSANNKQRWLPYLTSMTNNKALVGLEKVWNEKTMNESVDSDDVVTILKNIKSDANIDIIKQFDSNTISRKVFAHIITRQ